MAAPGRHVSEPSSSHSEAPRVLFASALWEATCLIRRVQFILWRWRACCVSRALQNLRNRCVAQIRLDWPDTSGEENLLCSTKQHAAAAAACCSSSSGRIGCFFLMPEGIMIPAGLILKVHNVAKAFTI